MKTNTELCIDLKTKLQNDVLMKPGKDYPGILRREIPVRSLVLMMVAIPLQRQFIQPLASAIPMCSTGSTSQSLERMMARIALT